MILTIIIFLILAIIFYIYAVLTAKPYNDEIEDIYKKEMDKKGGKNIK